MKKYILMVAMVLCVITSVAQDKPKHIRKDEKKQEKVERKSTGMEKSAGKNNGKRSIHKLHKMEKKEDKLNKKSEK